MRAAIEIQSANSLKDYQLVSRYWMEAIKLMEEVAPESHHYDTAQIKIAEYAKNLAYSQSLLASKQQYGP
ncbi:WD40 repeat domain-containing protein, partial [filamentous cyanobacterium CCT1]